MSSVNRRLPCLLALLAALGSAAHAQEVYRASWTIQDKSHGLRQELARMIIERANDWLTRDDQKIPTARLDDMLRVTVVGEMTPASGMVEPHLRTLELGAIVIDTSFGEFLDTATIASLVRRDHYWRDEQVVVFDPSRSPFAPTVDHGASDSSEAMFDRLFRDGERPRIRLAIDESSVRIAPDLYLWGGLGFDELALPGFSYGRARIGLAYNRLRIWGEVPAALDATESPLLARELEGVYGFGLSFEEKWFGGMISGAAAPRSDAEPAAGEGGYFISKTAMLYGILPIDVAFLRSFPLQAKLGIGYLQARPLGPGADDTAAPRFAGEGASALKLMAQLEYAQPTHDGSLERRAAIELFGQSIRATYQHPITPGFGIRVTGAAHGLFGDRDPFLPSFSITPSVVFIFR